MRRTLYAKISRLQLDPLLVLFTVTFTVPAEASWVAVTAAVSEVALNE